MITSEQVTYNGTTVKAKVDELVEAADLSDEINDIKITITNLQNEVNNNIKPISYVGMIIHTSTLDTMGKVIEIYGGTTWVKIEGRFLLGQSSSYAINSTGGSANAVVVEHQHTYTMFTITDNYVTGSEPTPYGTINAGEKLTSTSIAGESGIGKNMPPYKTVYIWERTA